MLKWILLVIVGLLVTIIHFVFSPVIALFVNNTGYLPSWLSWFQTSDNPAIGDQMFHDNQMAWTKSKYLYAVFWAMRNPGYGYDHWAGADITSPTYYAIDGNDYVCIDKVPGEPTRLIEGYVSRRVTTGGKKYFQFRLIKRWSKTRVMRLSFGWDLHSPMRQGTKRNLEFTISPAISM